MCSFFRGDSTIALNNGLTFIHQYEDVINAYISDFFTKEYWKVINPKWWSVLSKMEPEELASLLNVKTWKSNCVWPLSLLAFRSSIHSLSLPRLPQNIFLAKDVDHYGNVEDQALSPQDSVEDSHCTELEHCFTRHVKPKKRHEIVKLAKAVNTLSMKCKCQQVLDIGAGQGHLSRLLGFKFGLKATTIEAAGCHSPKAKKYDSEVKTDIEKGRVHSKQQQKVNIVKNDPISISSSLSPNHVTATIEPDISVDDFLKQVKKSIQSECEENYKDRSVDGACSRDQNVSQKMMHSQKGKIGRHNNQENEVDNDDSTQKGTEQDIDNSSGVEICQIRKHSEEKFLITGLHACGNLTATMLKMFVKCSDLKGIASVGCCYMKLTTSRRNSCGTDLGYPLSNYVNSLPCHYLSYEALEMACHFVDAYHQRLLDNSANLHSHCYRAALQEVIADKDPDFKHGCVKITVKNSQTMDFKQYAEKALKRLDLDCNITLSQLERAEERFKRWKEVVAFYTLRLSLAPVVESMILLDRLLYLQENGIDSKLVPIFNPLVSPRNFVLLATK